MGRELAWSRFLFLFTSAPVWVTCSSAHFVFALGIEQPPSGTLALEIPLNLTLALKVSTQK